MNKSLFLISLVLVGYAYYKIETFEKIFYLDREMHYATRRTVEGVANCKFDFVSIPGTIGLKQATCVHNGN